MKILPLAYFVVVLAGCTQNIQPEFAIKNIECFNRVEISNKKIKPVLCSDQKDLRTFRSNNFSIQVPGTLFRFNNSDGQVVFDTKPTNDPSNASDFSVSIDSIIDSPCSKGFAGLLHPKKDLQTGDWGRADIWESLQHNGWDPPYDPQNVICGPGMQHTYGFCAEKNNKTVVICIDQMTDNPEGAKKIFETFQWTK